MVAGPFRHSSIGLEFEFHVPPNGREAMPARRALPTGSPGLSAPELAMKLESRWSEMPFRFSSGLGSGSGRASVQRQTVSWIPRHLRPRPRNAHPSDRWTMGRPSRSPRRGSGCGRRRRGLRTVRPARQGIRTPLPSRHPAGPRGGSALAWRAGPSRRPSCRRACRAAGGERPGAKSLGGVHRAGVPHLETDWDLDSRAGSRLLLPHAWTSCAGVKRG